MAKKYTAQEMREVAKSLAASEVNLNFDKRDIAAMLRQAADLMEHSQTETAFRYEFAVQKKIKKEWFVHIKGSLSLDEAEDYMNAMCEMNPGYEFRIVRRKTADWEVVK